MRRDELLKSAGLRDACRILFGDLAEAKWAEYFGEEQVGLVSGLGG